MKPQYIIIDSGGPSVSATLPGFTTTRLAILHKFWETLEAFDGRARYRMVVPEPPQYSALQVVLAKLCFNPIEKISGKWEPVGDYDRQDVIDAIHRGLATDDDIIQQWYEGPDVIKLIESSTTFDEMVLAIRAIGGEHETDPQVLAYVERILGKQNEDA